MDKFETRDTIIKHVMSGSGLGIGPKIKMVKSGSPLKCPRCDDDSLHPMIAVPKIRGRPRSKKRRIQKKWTKRTRAELFVEGLALMAINMRPPFECSQCGYQAGFYRTMAESIFTVQPLPIDKLPIYTTETDNGDHTGTSS